MSAPRKEEGPGHHNPGDLHSGRHTQDTGSYPRAVVTATAEELPPAGRRTLTAFLVRNCPNCAGMHIHRSSGIVRPSCGQPYVIEVELDVSGWVA